MAKQQMGWIPPAERSDNQRAFCAEHDPPDFSSFKMESSELPERALCYDLELRALGRLMPRPRQVTGSCVGFSSSRSLSHAILGDAVLRGDMERIVLPHPLPSYGQGRKIGNFRGTGSGSYGSAQAKAVSQWGILPVDDPRLPAPKIVNGWAKWTKSQELEWSHPRAWPVDESNLAQDAKDYIVQTVARIRTTGEAADCSASGYGITLASSFGTTPRLVQNYLIGRNSRRWSHSMSCSGFDASEEAQSAGNTERLWAIDNQWGDSHGKCNVLSSYGGNGSFWVTEKTFAGIIDSGEVFAFSNTRGFPLRRIDWGDVGLSR